MKKTTTPKSTNEINVAQRLHIDENSSTRIHFIYNQLIWVAFTNIDLFNLNSFFLPVSQS